MGKIEEIVEVWGAYTETIEDWEGSVAGIEPKASGCGPIYEFKTNPIPDRPDEDFCIADMRVLPIAEPHYHPEGVTEIYFVLQGTGTVVVGNQPVEVEKGDVVVMSSLATHYTVPLGNLVLGVVNTPPFKPEDYLSVHETNADVAFDKGLFDSLKPQA